MDIETETVVPAPPDQPENKQDEVFKTPIRKRKRTLDSDDEEEAGAPLKKTVKVETPAKAIVKAEPKTEKSQTPKRKRKASSSSSDSSSSSGSTSSSGSYSDDSDSDSYSSSEESSPKKKKPSPKKKTPTKKTPTKKASPKKEVKKEVKKETKSPKKAKKEPSPSPKKKVKTENGDAKAVKKEKKDKKGDETPDNVWWKTQEDDSWKTGKKANWKWRTLEHNGVCFPPPYVPHGVQMLYDGKKVALTPDQEEVATFFARYMQTEHIKKPQFSKNFFAGFKKILGKGHVIKEFKKCDFTPILDHLNKEKEKRKERTKDEKEKEKKEKATLKEKYGYAIIDGRREELGNWNVEPPSLFLGRGDHPRAGVLKPRIHPSDVILNLGEDAPVPRAPNGEKYGGVVHNHEVGWVAFWRPKTEDGKAKYVLFSANSTLKGKSDLSKFDKAQQLGKNIEDIRKQYMAELTDDVDVVRQRATCLWIIDKLALRVGGEKSEKEADTVGCTSLRFEHLKLHDPADVEFDFLGKDSMRYQNRVTVHPQVFKNIKSFLKGKKKGEDVFDLIKPQSLNSYLQSMMKGLTAKVFRTYNASVCMQTQLDKWDMKKNKDATADEKLLFFNASSVEVAILCNHKRSVPQTFTDAMGKLDQQIKDAEDEIAEIKEHKKCLQKGKSPKKRVKKNPDDDEPKPLPSSVESCDKKIETLKARIKKIETKKKDKDQQKEISTGTSKTNYIDPRISITWCTKVGLDVSRIFPKTLRNKFGWAFGECEKKPNFRF